MGSFHQLSLLHGSQATLALFQRGYEVALNQPFSGSLVPLDFYQKESKVRSIMVEVRRDLVMDLSRRQAVSDDLDKIIGAL